MYGPPAAGKDTITDALCALDPRIVPFARLKIGTGRTRGYRMGTLDQLHGLEASEQVLYRNDRYANTYVIDRPGLDHATMPGSIAVIHLGQIAGITALTSRYPANWLHVLVTCSRPTSDTRSQLRGDTDTDERLAAWDVTAADLAAHPDLNWNLELDTDLLTPGESADRILTAVLDPLE